MEIRSVNQVAAAGQLKANSDGRTPAATEAAARSASGVEVALESADPAAAAAQADPAAQRRELEDSLKKVNDTVHLFNNSVQFSVDDETQRQVIKVVDLETDKVIRQIPSEDILAIARAFDKLQGILIKDKA